VTDVGRVRSHNEDTYLVRPDLGLYVVADGMGGHQAGDVASAMVRLSVTNFFEATEMEHWADVYDEPEDAGLPDDARRLVAAIRKANRDVYVVANSTAGHYGMGSTVVASYMPKNSKLMHIGHVGDSRCYRIRSGELKRLTRDHSLVEEALALDPEMTEDELARLPSNIVTRALGMDPSVLVDVRTVKVKPGDTYLLCSDGLSGLISNDEIIDAIELLDDPHEVCDLLVALANDAGGQDNITALVLIP
jgi:serine/threonine protein phosphatase PrpC